MKHSVLPPLRDESTLRDLVRDALVRSANSPLLRTPNPHRNHPILGDQQRVDNLIEQWPSAVDRIIYPHQFDFPANGRRIGEHHRIVNGEVA